MNLEGIPPIITTNDSNEQPISVARWRWWVHLVLLALFPLTIGALTIFSGSRKVGPALPEDVTGLLYVSVSELGFFTVLFCIAWLFSHANGKQLLLRWRGSWQPIVLGFVGSIVLRIAVMVLATIGMIFWFLLRGMNEKEMQNLKSQSEHIINASALTNNPLYLFLTLTLISFVVAGLREELWRAGMLAGFNALFPKSHGSFKKEMGYVCIVAVLFGLGHTLQGLSGVLLTTLLGVGLGAIMIWRKSIWEAVIAHGFFDASTFAMLYMLAKYFPEALKHVASI
ncbi:CPBP family intramembrane glutamic endopeptidase [Pedosphaera parvula]|uniref:Abortive infection protein n=1 Tax=Pedosphaera parvula (strain Ellin514) TaxID=320771 RepID=B9XF80_PEDPL|nr:CPBP family intramembrane glutamic endopeptidase [Pedosphaera parvula]EEF61578.1 Abortive infection protein [Pedosphaera parvula Ellin514]